ncbi:mitochondrial ribosomal protein S16, precursor [Cyanidioschyzon merolae strain 10D]|jgi:small subunit ribosomal protein S16|nr:mitochondrial ribosomal protein S16, precursor [Cyanidioschyzon merolae strain 10D]BAM83461.1 mitochondrial ribosomal protein S16, precursor [Cyanidioschyzon merolae strain 10D]|eukprot:XP_005539497.1 mitochondrial ribosomal protein S16, precursor [Cyanidioschyzon merolae strain 10D]
MSPVRIRLARHGRRHAAVFRIVVADSRAPRDGRFLEHVGTYNPRVIRGAKLVQFDVKRTQYWLSVGAQPSERVAKLLGLAGVLPPAPVRGRTAAPSAAAPQNLGAVRGLESLVPTFAVS